MSVNSADDISQKPTDEEVNFDRDEGQAGKFFADAGDSCITLAKLFPPRTAFVPLAT
jgi:hypothetical protein